MFGEARREDRKGGERGESGREGAGLTLRTRIGRKSGHVAPE